MNVDLPQALVEYKQCDLSVDIIPYPDSYFDRITAIDVLEHIQELYILQDENLAL